MRITRDRVVCAAVALFSVVAPIACSSAPEDGPIGRSEADFTFDLRPGWATTCDGADGSKPWPRTFFVRRDVYFLPSFLVPGGPPIPTPIACNDVVSSGGRWAGARLAPGESNYCVYSWTSSTQWFPDYGALEKDALAAISKPLATWAFPYDPIIADCDGGTALGAAALPLVEEQASDGECSKHNPEACVPIGDMPQCRACSMVTGSSRMIVVLPKRMANGLSLDGLGAHAVLPEDPSFQLKVTLHQWSRQVFAVTVSGPHGAPSPGVYGIGLQ